MTELKDTVNLMASGDFKERYKAEYLQLKIRTEKLAAMLDKWRKGELPFTPKSPRSLLEWQLDSMLKYRAALEARALIEGVDLAE